MNNSPDVRELAAGVQALVDHAAESGCIRSESGATTIWYAVSTAFLMIVGIAAISAGAVFSGLSRLQGIADLSALAGADAAPLVELALDATEVARIGCAVAAMVVASNEAELQSCTFGASDILVVVTKDLRVAGVPVALKAKARAGPP